MNWNRFKQHHTVYPDLGFALDISRIPFPDGYIEEKAGDLEKALDQMEALEGGSIANPDENRMVGHYWLRDPDRAPDPKISDEIRATLDRINSFTAKVHSGNVAGAGGAFTDLLVIGIGGSALGPQFVSHALGDPRNDRLRVHFFDNTDPDGFDLVLAEIGNRLNRTLSIVISKSGGTKETRNGMLEAKAAYEAAGLSFAAHAVAVTGDGSALDRVAVSEGWLGRFPMWDWVGGRTSVTGTVGLLPAALQGLDIGALLEGAREMDSATRKRPGTRNPAALLALMWYYSTEGRGKRDMVILPYKDRLLLFSRYLQQLIMESLGKEFDLDGKRVNQGIAVYGNKGSTDQHAYVQQLREGVANFFVTFIEVLKDRAASSMRVEDEFTSGDYLQGFLLGTRDALSEMERTSITLTVDEISPKSVGLLIALYERTVGLYASLIHVNAYHQPGVEAGKKAAEAALDLKRELLDALKKHSGQHQTAEAIAASLGREKDTERVYKLLTHLAANPDRRISRTPGATWDQDFFTRDDRRHLSDTLLTTGHVDES
ncbi:MAG: glucose-6-phosphate isomerase [Verrucomicrobia bacterium]|nr:MAG: glucose-6-phosphate isomerase [Verrucomicrobiota bacterium]